MAQDVSGRGETAEVVSTPAETASLGERVRKLRMAQGLTQRDLAADRFSKEYVSQIERGKTRPTWQTVLWLAKRLETDPAFLQSGVSSEARERARACVARAEAAIARRDYAGTIEALDALPDLANVTPDIELREALARSWALMYLGSVREAVMILTRAWALVEERSFTDIDRAEVMYRLGCCRYKLSSVVTAISLFGTALELTERSPLPCQRLQAHILEWRSRCYRRQRDWEAAREDVDRALELARELGDGETMAHVLFQASLVAERNSDWQLARSYAEQAKGLYEEIDDRGNVGRLLNNLGGLSFLLGEPEQATELLKDAFGVALEVGSDPDAAQAISSLAQVHLRTGHVELAETQARQALDLLGDRVDFQDEIGNAQLVLGRSLLEQGRLDEAGDVFAQAEETMGALGSTSHEAAVWVAQGDLATRQGSEAEAAGLYRRAAEALQDFHF
ncbi:MAG: helix-turn-helix domain-containing protein [Solirubrobacterales bacterium]